MNLNQTIAITKIMTEFTVLSIKEDESAVVVTYDNDKSIMINPTGDKVWYQNGEIHRTDGPAVEYAGGTKYWLQNGMKHRIDGPAEERSDGVMIWFQNGEIHRTDGPAAEYIDGHKLWFQNGKLYREDGPNIELAGDGNMYWFRKWAVALRRWFCP